MRKIIYAFLVSTALFSSAFADQVKIGVIDVRQVLQEAKQMKDINAKLQKEYKPRQEKIMAEQKRYEEMMTKLKRDSAIMTDSEKSKLQEQIVQSKRDIQRLEQDYQQDLAMTQNKEMQTFFNSLKQLLAKYAQDNHYDFILQKETVPYVNETGQFDVTKKIIEIMADKQKAA